MIKLAVIGDPIAHSLSPVVHSTVLDELGIEHSYEKLLVTKDELTDFLKKGCKSLAGFSLTMPHKKACMPHLDFIDDDAQLLGSVNTVKVQENKLLGFNTDGNGFLHALKNKGFDCKDKNIVIFGAGGVVSTVALKLAMAGAKQIVILNRTLSSAQTVAENVLEKTGKKIIFDSLTLDNMSEYCKHCDLVVNGTPLGMEGVDANFEDFSFLKSLKSSSLVFDLIYKPSQTKLLNHASSLGLETLNGLGMLIFQGLIADELFLERELDFAYLNKKVEDKLKNL